MPPPVFPGSKKDKENQTRQSASEAQKRSETGFGSLFNYCLGDAQYTATGTKVEKHCAEACNGKRKPKAKARKRTTK
jgi:hypothetical protein